MREWNACRVWRAFPPVHESSHSLATQCVSFMSRRARRRADDRARWCGLWRAWKTRPRMQTVESQRECLAVRA
jgi:hypothetical protein